MEYDEFTGSDNPKVDEDPYEAFLSKGGFEEIWQTIEGNTFAITEDTIFIEKGIGPLDDTDIEFDRVDEYEVAVNHARRSPLLFVPFALTGIFLLMSWVFGEAGFGTVTLILAGLSFVGGCILVVQHRNKITEDTYITIKIGRFSETVGINGNVKQRVTELLDPHIERHIPEPEEPGEESS